MKKILLATTALMLSAAVANAQAVRIGGQGRMGVQYDNTAFGGTNNGSRYRTENRLQFNFSVGVQADHGVSFGAFTRARMQTAGTPTAFGTNQPAMFSGSRVWVEANNLRLTFGNQDGAFRGVGASHGYLGGCYIGYEGGQQCGDSAALLGRTQGFNSTGAQGQSVVRVDYSFGDTAIAVSNARGGSTELGIRSRFDAFTVALGYSNRANAAGAIGRTIAVSGHYNGGTWGVGAIVARLTNGAGAARVNVTTWSLSGNVELGGGNLTAYIGRVGAGANTRAYGINYGYGLGGGATLHVGGERVGTTTTASVGVVFNF